MDTERENQGAEHQNIYSRFRRLVLVLGVVWLAGGILLLWPSTADCFNHFIQFGTVTAVGSCVPIAALSLFGWSVVGLVLTLMAIYWLKRDASRSPKIKHSRHAGSGCVTKPIDLPQPGSQAVPTHEIWAHQRQVADSNDSKTVSHTV